MDKPLPVKDFSIPKRYKVYENEQLLLHNRTQTLNIYLTDNKGRSGPGIILNKIEHISD